MKFEEIWIIGVVHFLFFFLSFTNCKMQGRNPKSFTTHYVRKLLLRFWKLRIQKTHNLLFLTAFSKILITTWCWRKYIYVWQCQMGTAQADTIYMSLSTPFATRCTLVSGSCEWQLHFGWTPLATVYTPLGKFLFQNLESSHRYEAS